MKLLIYQAYLVDKIRIKAKIKHFIEKKRKEMLRNSLWYMTFCLRKYYRKEEESE